MIFSYRIRRLSIRVLYCIILRIMNRYLMLILCVLLASLGHVMFKSSANTLKSLNSIWGLALEPMFVLALCLYGFTTVAWIWCLQEIPLSRAYLFMSLAYVFIPLFSWICFGESISLQYVFSVCLIVTGIMIAVVKI